MALIIGDTKITQEDVKQLCSALESFMVSMNSDEQFVGHNQAYRETVCVPRAKEILDKLQYDKKLKNLLWKEPICEVEEATAPDTLVWLKTEIEKKQGAIDRHDNLDNARYGAFEQVIDLIDSLKQK